VYNQGDENPCLELRVLARFGSLASSERHPLLSVVIPCANEQEVLRETNARLLAVLQQISLDFEIVYVKTLPFL
jgi:hypothetical protein